MGTTTKILTGIIVVLALGLVAVLGLRLSTPEDTWLCQDGQWVKHGNPSLSAPTTGCGASVVMPTSTPLTEQNVVVDTGIVVYSPKLNVAVTSPLIITGQVTDKNNWVGFEGQVGAVKLMDGGNVLASGILQATSDWMKFPVNFRTILNFDTSKIVGFDAIEGKLVKLVFSNENPSGDPVRSETYSLPIKIMGSANTQMNVSVFFPNNKLDPNMLDCSKVFRTTRTITQTTAVARAALEELFKGPTAQEKTDGYSTSIPAGVKIQKLTIENGVAKVDLNKNLEQQVGGSCRTASIYAEITQTLKQFPTVQSVVISIDGRTEDILQP